jgi:hypothetical protein
MRFTTWSAKGDARAPPYLELFARETRAGWTSCVNEPTEFTKGDAMTPGDAFSS